MIRWTIRVFAVILLLAGIAGVVGYRSLSEPYRGFEGDRILEIGRGSTSRQIAKQLADAGVVKNEWVFLAARAFQRAFVMADGVEVAGAHLEHGLLHIDLKRSVPETVVQTIAINSGSRPQPAPAAARIGQK